MICVNNHVWSWDRGQKDPFFSRRRVRDALRILQARAAIELEIAAGAEAWRCSAAGLNPPRKWVAVASASGFGELRILADGRAKLAIGAFDPIRDIRAAPQKLVSSTETRDIQHLCHRSTICIPHRSYSL